MCLALFALASYPATAEARELKTIEADAVVGRLLLDSSEAESSAEEDSSDESSAEDDSSDQEPEDSSEEDSSDALETTPTATPAST